MLVAWLGRPLYIKFFFPCVSAALYYPKRVAQYTYLLPPIVGRLQSRPYLDAASY